jgi:hypothetical protein
MKSRKILHGSFIGLLVFMLFGCGSAPSSSVNTTGMDLDAAIKDAAAQMETKIPSGTMIALVSMASPSTAFSTQVLTRLESAIVSSGKLVVVDRANLDKVRAEQGFQLSGEVDDESAKSIGKLLGAGAIVTGSLTDLGDVYSLTLKAINIETATVAISYLADLAKTKRIETLLASRDGAAQTRTQTASTSAASSGASSAQAPAVAAPAPVVKEVYTIGETGPAGGIIFYDKGNNSGGWRFLEAAPSDAGKGEWGQEVSGTKSDIGSGKQNTQLMRGMASTLCLQYELGGYRDWFLPSKEELDLMFVNLKIKGLGRFSGDYYWSSTWEGAGWHTVWFQHFNDGSQGKDGTSRPYLVRPIRQF